MVIPSRSIISVGRAVFRGNNEINMDAKGRMAIPARYRDVLSSDFDGRLVVTIDPQQIIADRCLMVYPEARWIKTEEKLRNLSTFDPAARKYQRLFIGYARDLEMDGSGRILMPAELRDYAGLNKKVVLVGQGLRFELWDSKAWTTKRDELLAEDFDLSDISDAMQSLSL